MFSRRIIEPVAVHQRLFFPISVFGHTSTCPANQQQRKKEISPGATKKGGDDNKALPTLKRAVKPGPVRMGFIPEEWFQFFNSKTGVSGPYFLMLGLTNYFVSKEIFVMEHEYYSGISIFIVVYYVTTRFGPTIGESFDKKVDAIAQELEKSRNDEIAAQDTIIKTSQDAIWRADGQKLLMDAKKENIALQLEAAYRERLMMVYQGVRGRMDYHVKKNMALVRLHQKWMIQWILDQVAKSITPEFQKQALDSAINELANLSNRSK